MLKRTLSLVLAFVMVFSLLPLNALAEELGTDENEELLLNTTDVVDEEQESTTPSETVEKTESDETVPATVPETEAPTVPETEAPTVPETEAPTVPETVPATVPETEPDTTLEPDSELTEDEENSAESDMMIMSTALAANGTWTLGESKTLALPAGPVYPSPDLLASATPDYTFTFAPDHAGRYIFCWDNSQNRGPGPHVRITCGAGTYGSGNVYAAFPVTENDINDHLVYTVNVYSQCWEDYSAEIYLKEVTTQGSISFPQQNLTMAKGQTSQFLLNRSPMNYPFEGLTFKSSDSDIVEIQSTSFGGCVLKAVNEGTATITATDKYGKEATCTVTVEVYEEWALNDTKTLSLSGDFGDPWHMDQLDPSYIFTFTPEENGEYIVCWDNKQNRGNGPHVVVQGPGMDQGGNVYNAFYGVAGGTYTIKVYAMADESYEAELWLTKSTTDGSISFGDSTRLSAIQGERFWLSVERSSINYLSGDVDFTSSNEDCVRVKTDDFSACELEAVGPGTATITATDENKNTCTCEIEVAKSEPLALNATKSVHLEPHGEAFYSFTAPGNDNYTFWDQNNNEFLVEIPLNEGGTDWSYGSIQFAGSKGTAYCIHVTNNTEEPQNYNFIIKKNVAISAISLSLSKSTVYVGDIVDVYTNISPINANSEEINFRLDRKDIAQLVDSDEYVYPRLKMLKAGTVKLTATTANTKRTKTCTFTVQPAPDSIASGHPVSKTLPKNSATSLRFRAPENLPEGTWYTIWNNRVDTDVDLEVVDTETNDQIGWGSNVLHFQPQPETLYTVNLYNWDNWNVDCEIHAEPSVEPTALRTRVDAYTGYEGGIRSYRVWYETEPFYARVNEDQFSVKSSSEAVIADRNTGWDPYWYLLPSQPGKATVTATYKSLSDAFTFTVLKVDRMRPGDEKWVTVPAHDSVSLRVDLAGVVEGTPISVWEDNGKPVDIYAADPYYVSGYGSIQFVAKGTDEETCLIALTNGTQYAQTYCIRAAKTEDIETGKSITLADQTIYVGESVDLFAKLSPSLRLASGISWKASNTKIKLLEADGNQASYRGISAGTVTVTATAVDESGQSFTDTCTVTVLANPAALVAGKCVYGTVMDGSEPGWTTYSFTPTSAGLYALRDEYLSAVNIRVIDPVTGDVDDLGNGRNYSFVKGRKYYITVSATEDVPQNYALRVEKCVDPTLLSIDPEVSVVAVGESARLWGYSMPEYSYYGRLTWSVDDADIATIRVDNNSESCVVTMKKAGTAIVSAKTANGLTAQTRIVAVDSIEALTPGTEQKAYVNNSSLPTVFTFSPDKPGEYVLRETSGKQLRYTVYDGANYYADGTGTLRFTANGGRTYRIAVNAYYESRGDCEFLIKPVEEAQSISFGYTKPIEAYVGEVIELPLNWKPINSDRGQVTWTVTNLGDSDKDGVRILSCWNDGADIQVMKAGSYLVTATAGNLTAQVTLIANAAPAPFVKNTKMTLEAGTEETFVFKADSTGDHTLWAESNKEWVELMVTDQATGQSVSGSNMLHGYLVAGHQYTIVFRNGNANPVSFTAKLEKDVKPTSIRISEQFDIPSVDGYLWLEVSSLPVNSKLSNVNWSIDKTDVAEILSEDDSWCQIRLKQAGSLTVTATSNGATATMRIGVNDTLELTDKTFTIEPNTGKAFRFTPEKTADYTAFQANDSGEYLWVSVHDVHGGYLVAEGSSGATFRGIAGETYLVRFSNYNDAEVKTVLSVEESNEPKESGEPTSIKIESVDKTTEYYVGETVLVRASYDPKNAKRGQIDWPDSVDDGVEIVEKYGFEALVKFTNIGDQTVTATDGTVTGTLTFTVLPDGNINKLLGKDVDLGAGFHRIYSFIAAAGDYVFYDENNSGCSLVLFNSNGEELASGRRIHFRAEAGKAYRLGVTNGTGTKAKLALHLEQDEPLTELSLPERINGTVGSTIDVIALPDPLNASIDDISWSVDNANVAQITQADADLASIRLLTPGTATLTAWCGGQKATCAITVKSPVTFEKETVRKVTLAPGESVHYQFTAPAAGTYVLWDEGMQDVRFIATSGNVDSNYEDRLVMKAINAGEVYDIEIRNNAAQAVALTLHLESGTTADDEATLSFAQGDNLVLYSGQSAEVNVIMKPYNRVDAKFVASLTDDTGTVTIQPLSRPGHYEITAEQAGTTTLTVTGYTIGEPAQMTIGEPAKMTITVKDREELAIGVPTTMTGSTVSMGRSIFTPSVPGSYALEVTAPEGYSVEVRNGNITIGVLRNGQSVGIGTLEKDSKYYSLSTQLLDAQGNPASGDYSICVIPELPAGSNPITSKGTVQLKVGDEPEKAFAIIPAVEGLAKFSVDDSKIVEISNIGEIKAKASGTAYVTCTLTLGSKTYKSQCRVDVLPEKKDEIADVQYSTTSPTVELYKTAYTTITAIPYKQTVEGRQVLREALTTPIKTAEFTTRKDTPTVAEQDAVDFLNDYFKLEPLDGRTIQIVPNADMANDVYVKKVSVKGYYDVKLKLTFADETVKTTNFRLNIRKTEPKLTAAKMVFNAFMQYDDGYESLPITLKGGTVNAIEENTDKQNDRTNALDKWLELNSDSLKLVYAEGYQNTKKYSGNVFLLVDTAEWVVPAKVTVPVSVSYQARGLKLSATSVTMGGGDAWERSKGVNLNLLCTNRKESLELLKVSDLVSNDDRFIVQNFDRTTGSFTLVPTEKITPDSRRDYTEVKLGVLFGDTTECVYLKVKVTPKAVTLAAKPSRFNLNCVRGDCAVINLIPTPADYAINSLDDIEWTLVDSRGNSAESLFNVYFDNGTLYAETTDKTVAGTAYKLIANVPGSTKKTTITLSTLTEQKSQITASAKISGAIDLTFPDSYVAIQPTLSNYLSKDYTFDYQITDRKGNVLKDIAELFRLVNVNGQYRLMANDPNHRLTRGTYYLRPIVTLADGRNPNPDKTTIAQFTVKRSAVSLKVSKTKVTLNQQIGDWVALDVTCLTKGYDFVNPIITKVVPRGFTDLDNLNAEYVNGKLLISFTGETEAYYGKTFTISLKARDVKEDRDRAVNVSVVIPKKDVQIGAKLAVKGYVDIVRGSTSAVITPTYLNYSGGEILTPEITIMKYAAGDRKYLSPMGDASDVFDVVRNDNGTFTVTRKPGAQIDLVDYKYRAEMHFRGKNVDPGLVTTSVVALPVRSNSVRVTTSGTPVLYKSDKYSRATFRLNIADASVNSIQDVTSNNAQYRIEYLGNGECAIYFNAWKPTTKYAGSVQVNVFVDGNVNAAVKTTVRLTIK